MQTLDQNEAHRQDNISVRLIKTRELLTIKPFEILFNNCVKQDVFPNI